MNLSHIIITSCLLKLPLPPVERTIDILRQQRGGWLGSEKWYFLLIFSTIYADVGGLVGPIKTKYMDSP